MLFQIQQRFKDKSRKLCGQIDVESLGELNDFIQEIKKCHPLPKYKTSKWLCCEKNSEYFIKKIIF